ncbi:MAG TPA: hypothetical protein VLM85_14835 [Polyangiaceae bacterium]|nr:hypothetical protein [Polyangiaceae bacterium]
MRQSLLGGMGLVQQGTRRPQRHPARPQAGKLRPPGTEIDCTSAHGVRGARRAAVNPAAL